MTDTDFSAALQNDRGPRGPRDLPSLAAAFSRARRSEVPSYAPAAFRNAVEAWRVANAASGDERAREYALEQAVHALADAEARADRAAEVLQNVTQLRAAALRSERERFTASEVLADAEEHYRLAVGRAEEGDLQAAEAEADAAESSFREATLLALERGPVVALETAVREGEFTTSPAGLRAASAELGDIREAVDTTKRGEQGVTQLRRRLAVGGRRIGSALDDLLDPTIIDPVLPTDPIGPVRPGKPERVTAIRVTERAADSLTVTWLSPPTFADRNVLLRQREAGPWEPVEEFGPLQGWTTHTDTGLDPETLYCYRVQSENDQGIVATPVDKRAGGYTRATESIRVWRVQLRVRTADVADAGTSDAIEARLTSPLSTFNPNGNRRWLDYGPRWEGSGLSGWRDDFARDREFTYDLDQRYVRELSDITMLTIAKDGTDAVGIAEIGLLVNNEEVFTRVFGETASSCLWIDDGDGHQPQYTVWHGELRADPKWQAYVAGSRPRPFTIPNAELVSRIESLVGHAIHGTEAYWGEFSSPAWVEATFVDSERLHVDIDLEADVPVLSDPEIDIDFDLRFSFSCDQAAGTATLSITSENLGANVDFDFLTELFGTVLTLGQFGRLEKWIANEITDSFDPIVERILADTGGICPTATVLQNGDVIFGLG